MSPFQVVRSGLLARHSLDDVLQVPPEAHLLQRVVQPTCSDAEVRLMRGDVMDAVVLAREDDVAVLQEHDPARQAEVRVRPLVNLVGERHEDGQCKQVAVQGVDMVNLRRGEGEEVEGHVGERNDGQHAVVTVSLDEIMTGDSCGVDVVLSERTYKGLSKDG